jgi:predicted transcriptional regulator
MLFMARMTVAISDELQHSLDRLARGRGQSRSALVEMLLRESPLVQEDVAVARRSLTKRGRDPAKLRAIADQAR